MPTKFGGRRVSVGYAKETVRGTYAAPTYWEKQASLVLDEDVEIALDSNAFGSIEDAQDQHITNKWVKGEVTANVKDKSFGLLTGLTLGTDTPAAQGAPNAAVYDHVITVLESNQHPSFSVGFIDPVASYGFTNCMVDSLALDYELGKFFNYKLGFLGQAGATQSPTASYVTENYFLPQHGTFKQASLVSGLAGASATTIKKFALNIKKNIERDSVLGSIAPSDFLNKQLEVTGDLEAYFQNEADFKTNFLADTSQAMLLNVINSDVTLATSSHPQVQFQISKTKFISLGRDMGINNIVKQKVAFKALYDSVTTSMLKATISNLVTTAFV